MSRLRVFRQTGWFIAGLMTGLPATAAPAEASSMAGVAVAVATTTPPDATATLQAMQSCRRESAALERLDCYDRLLAPLSPSGLTGRWSKPVLWARPGPAPQSRKNAARATPQNCW
ncbi:type VI secretion-associated protein [Escherichia coli]|uniref:Type VI secretion-associated protein n=1 Tax=Escherichia coli TaxID=562 RepID=A0A377DJA2_ECOLX|nr:type VI secretion-associated protein [Escherichia coli]